VPAAVCFQQQLTVLIRQPLQGQRITVLLIILQTLLPVLLLLIGFCQSFSRLLAILLFTPLLNISR